MKRRLAYSPKENKLGDRKEANFKKSPHKYSLYEVSHPSSNLVHKDNISSTWNFREFDNLKKVTDEAASLRQTMNSRYLGNLNNKHILQFEDKKDGKANEFLRQTFSSRNNKAFSQTLISDYAYSVQNFQKDYDYQRQTTHQNLQPHQIHRKGLELLVQSKNLQQYQKLNEKINRNKLLIDQLRKAAHNDYRQDKDYLKNVNQHKTLTYVQLEDKNQKDFTQHKTHNKDEAKFLFTPKVQKSQNETAFSHLSPTQNTKRKQKNYDHQINNLSIQPTIKRSNSNIFSRSCIVQDFIIDKKLGQGKFGVVNLVRHKKTNSIVALKKIPKSLIKSNMMIEQLALQIRIQSSLKNSNILQMYGFFDDKTHLYIILEYMTGGTLYQKLKKQKMGQKQAAYIIKQIATAIDYLHDIGIAHRDIKPENIVISNNVYKLCDFGWAAICDERRKTYCGTFDYVAPEILQGVSYDITVDLWCLGVLTYQILTGKAPFYHISRKQTMKRILNVQHENLIFPQKLSQEAKDFIQKLIRKNPIQRIKASQALKHPFLKFADDQN